MVHAQLCARAGRTLSLDSHVHLAGRRCNAVCARERLRSSGTSPRFPSPKPRPSAAKTMRSKVWRSRRVGNVPSRDFESLCHLLRAARSAGARRSLQSTALRTRTAPTVARRADFDDTYELPSLSMDQVRVCGPPSVQAPDMQSLACTTTQTSHPLRPGPPSRRVPRARNAPRLAVAASLSWPPGPCYQTRSCIRTGNEHIALQVNGLVKSISDETNIAEVHIKVRVWLASSQPQPCFDPFHCNRA